MKTILATLKTGFSLPFVWLKQSMFWIFRKIGIVYTFHSIKQEKQTINMRTDGWVIITDGHSSDALPITFVSEWLQTEFIKYHPDAIKDDNEAEDADNK